MLLGMCEERRSRSWRLLGYTSTVSTHRSLHHTNTKSTTARGLEVEEGQVWKVDGRGKYGSAW